MTVEKGQIMEGVKLVALISVVVMIVSVLFLFASPVISNF